jgi:hypothetical protein
MIKANRYKSNRPPHAAAWEGEKGKSVARPAPGSGEGAQAM